MRVLIVSDTHKKHENLITIMEKERPFDRMIHLGDAEGYEDYIAELAGCPLDIVAGNNDFFSELPKEKEIEIGGLKALITHGHYYYVSAGLEDIKKEARGRGMDIVMFGTHPQTAYRKGSWCSGIESGQHIISSSGWSSAVLYCDGNRRKWYSGLSAQISF